MLPQTIRITDSIRNLIISKRREKKLTGIELSNAINQTTSYISALENSRIKNVPSATLVKIFSILFDIDTVKAESQIEDLISNRIRFETPTNSTDNITNNILKKSSITHYKTFEDNTNNAEIDDLVNLLKKMFYFLSDADSKEADILLKVLPRNMEFDLGFMVAIWQAPFFGFKPLSHEARQNFLLEFAELFKKYALIAKSKSEDSKKIKPESTKSDISNDDASFPNSDSGSNADLKQDDNT